MSTEKYRLDKYALFHYMNGYNTNRKRECSVDDWFKSREHVSKNGHLKDFMAKTR